MSAPGKRPAQHTNECKSYRSSGQRDKNRNRRAARIAKGFRVRRNGLNVPDYRRALRRHPGMGVT